MELRRALLLFAIVLGLAAVVSSLARPPRDQTGAQSDPAGRPDAPSTPTATAQPAHSPVPTIRFVVGRPRRTQTLKAGSAATVTVVVEEPGEVTLGGLGLTAGADPLTPARFDVLSTRPGRHPVRFRAVPDTESRLLGVLQIVPAPLP